MYQRTLTLKQLKRQAKEWEKTFANLASDNGLISRIHKKLPCYNSMTKTKQPNSKMGKGLD